MAAAVSAASTFRLFSGRTGLSGKSALPEGVGLLEELGIGTGAGAACAAGPLMATGFAKTGGEVITATGRLLAGTSWRPIE
jgi:hypothetical protein